MLGFTFVQPNLQIAIGIINIAGSIECNILLVGEGGFDLEILVVDRD